MLIFLPVIVSALWLLVLHVPTAMNHSSFVELTLVANLLLNFK